MTCRLYFHAASQREGIALAKLQCAQDLKTFAGVEVRESSVQVPDSLHLQLLLSNLPKLTCLKSLSYYLAQKSVGHMDTNYREGMWEGGGVQDGVKGGEMGQM